MGQLGWKRRPENLRQLQAAAAVGQAFLIRAYDEGLRRHRRHAAQILLTHEDFDSRPRYLNVRNTLHALFECDAVPIINENDTISVDEMKLGDNDQLAAMVTNLLQAPLLVILSVVDGLYRAMGDGQGPGELVPLVSQIDEQVLSLAASERSTLGTGGMQSKLIAARRVTQAGGSVIIASGTQREPLTRILSGEPVGTLFMAHGARHKARKRWIGLTARPRGYYVVDDGARRRLSQARGACWRSALSKSWVISKRVTSSAFATAQAANSHAGSRTTRLPMPSASRAFAPTRPAMRSAWRPTTRSSTATTWRSLSDRQGVSRHGNAGKLERDFDVGAGHGIVAQLLGRRRSERTGDRQSDP